MAFRGPAGWALIQLILVRGERGRRMSARERERKKRKKQSAAYYSCRREWKRKEGKRRRQGADIEFLPSTKETFECVRERERRRRTQRVDSSSGLMRTHFKWRSQYKCAVGLKARELPVGLPLDLCYFFCFTGHLSIAQRGVTLFFFRLFF